MVKIKKLLSIITAALLIFSLAACNPNGGEAKDPNTYVNAEAIEIPQPDPITETAEIGPLPAHPVLPSLDVSKAPYIFGEAGSKGIFDAELSGSSLDVSYSKAPANWDYFYIDVANWQAVYPYMALIFSGNKAGAVTQVTVAAAYAEMGNNPLVPIFVETVMKETEAFYFNIENCCTINSSYNFTQDLLINKTLNRLYFFVDSNPAQAPSNADGDIVIEAKFYKNHPQQPVYDSKTITQNTLSTGSATAYNINSSPVSGIATLYRTTTSANTTKGSYVEFPLEDYIVAGTEFTDLIIELNAKYTRSITVAAVFEVPSAYTATWNDCVLLKTFNTISTNSEDGASRFLNGDYGEVINLLSGSVLTKAGAKAQIDGKNVPLSNYKIIALRFFIDAGSDYYAAGADITGASSISTDSTRLVTIKAMDFRVSEAQGVRIGKGWFLQAGNNYMTLQPSTIEMGGKGKITVGGAGDWYWFGMPVSEYETGATLLTIQVSGPTDYLHLGVELNFLNTQTNGYTAAVFSGSAGTFDYENTVVMGNYDTTGTTSGSVRRITYDRPTDTYTLTINYSGSLFGQAKFALSEIRIYLNCPSDSLKPASPSPFEVEFKGVTVTAPQQ